MSKEKLKELHALRKGELKTLKSVVKDQAAANKVYDRQAAKVQKLSEKIDKLEAKLNPVE